MPYSGPVASAPTLITLANGAVVPSDSADIKAAKLAHSQAGGAIEPATGGSSAAGLSYAAGASSLPYSGPLPGTPTLVTLANGAVVPSDSAEVKAAKLAHSQSGGAIEPATGVSSSAGLSFSAGASSAIIASSPLVTYAAEPVVFTA